MTFAMLAQRAAVSAGRMAAAAGCVTLLAGCELLHLSHAAPLPLDRGPFFFPYDTTGECGVETATDAQLGAETVWTGAKDISNLRLEVIERRDVMARGPDGSSTTFEAVDVRDMDGATTWVRS